MFMSNYPPYLTKNLVLPSGAQIFVRPIQPEDEPLLQSLIRNLDPRDARFRFFAPVHELTHAAAEGLTRLDDTHEMAIAAFASVKLQQEMLGVAWIFANPDNYSAEFAICVQSAHRGEGLGILLMKDIIQLARQWGLTVLWGDVMNDNRRMLDMCAELGMTRSASPLGAGIVRVTLNLDLNYPSCAAG
ncbi:MAG: GNAT family N-acetyltransferase [Rhodospirillaceae bacterium]|nr:GNAT family N-acetyltransferase [Rhodospirillaceae bacterium]